MYIIKIFNVPISMYHTTLENQKETSEINFKIFYLNISKIFKHVISTKLLRYFAFFVCVCVHNKSSNFGVYFMNLECHISHSQ